MDAITIDCLALWFIQVGRRLGYIEGNHWTVKALASDGEMPSDASDSRATFVEPTISMPAEAVKS